MAQLDPTGQQFSIVELEPDFLSYCLTDTYLWIKFNDHILPSYFKNKNVALVFRIFKKFFEKYSQLPNEKITLSVLNKYDAKQDTLEFARNVYRSANTVNAVTAKYINDEITKFIKEEKMQVAILKASELLAENDYSQIEEIIKDALVWNPDINIGTKLNDVDKRFAEIDKVYNNYIESPWPSYNKSIGGGFFAKELTICSAASSVGKSIFLDNVATHAWLQGKNVALITLELSEMRKGLRIDCSLLERDMKSLIHNKDVVKSFYKDLETGGTLFIKEFPTSTAHAGHIKQYLYHLKIYEGIEQPDLLVIDYPDIMLPIGKKTDNMYQDSGRVYEQCRALGQEGNFPVVAASQMSKAVLQIKSIDEFNEDKLAESFKKMMIADNITGLFATKQMRDNNQMYFKNLKSRNGVKDFTMPINIDYSYLKMWE
jgi:replicative DNA helicase